MAILKSSPSELAIHGGGPPAFDAKIPVFSANAGDGRRFAELAERMFMATEPTGSLVEEFEAQLSKWIGVRNVVGFSSRASAMRSIARTQRPGPRFGPPLSIASFGSDDLINSFDCERANF